jgi:tetratricopeptide (TPR) repeat protein
MGKLNPGYLFLLFIFAGCDSGNKQQVITQGTDSITSLKSLDSKIIADPKNADNYFARAQYYFNHQKIQPAYDDAIKALQLDSSKSEYFVLLSDIYFVNVQTGKTRHLLERAIETDPKNTAAILKLAELYLYVKEYNKSIDQVDKALKVDKYNAKAYFIKGMNFKEKGDTARAISSFETTVEQDPDYYNAYMQLANINASKNNKNALDYYNSALNINPKSLEALYGRAMFYQQTGDFDKAIENYNSILQLDPKFEKAHYNIGFIDFQYSADYQNALIHFNDAVKANPSYYQAYYMRGLCHEKMRNYKQAELEYTAALQLKSDYQLAIEGIKRLHK